jgi:hypothetical protein
MPEALPAASVTVESNDTTEESECASTGEEWLKSTEAMIAELIDDVQRWKARSRLVAPKRRGRGGTKDRPFFARQSARTLLAAGVHLTKTRNGRFAAALAVLLDAADYSVPEDLFPILKQTIDHPAIRKELQGRIPGGVKGLKAWLRSRLSSGTLWQERAPLGKPKSKSTAPTALRKRHQ